MSSSTVLIAHPPFHIPVQPFPLQHFREQTNSKNHFTTLMQRFTGRALPGSFRTAGVGINRATLKANPSQPCPLSPVFHTLLSSLHCSRRLLDLERLTSPRPQRLLRLLPIFFSNIFFESQKPCFVLPNEFGPDEVGVSRPMLRIRIRHSAGISSGSLSSLSSASRNAFATGFISRGGSLLAGAASFICMPATGGFVGFAPAAAPVDVRLVAPPPPPPPLPLPPVRLPTVP